MEFLTKINWRQFLEVFLFGMYEFSLFITNESLLISNMMLGKKVIDTSQNGENIY